MSFLNRGAKEYRKRFNQVRLAMDVIADFCVDMRCEECPFRLEEGEIEDSFCKFVESPEIPSVWFVPKEEDDE